MSSTPNNEYILPRNLSNEELWAAYEMDLPGGINSQVLQDYSIPILYHPVRLTYELVPPAIGLDKHLIRLYEMDLLQCVTGMGMGELKTWRKDMPIERRLKESERLRLKANEAYRKGTVAMLEMALTGYMYALATTLPWHCDALPLTDLRRDQLGRMETAIFANVSAAMTTLARLQIEYRETRLDGAFKSAWLVVERRENASSSSVRNCCQRAHALVEGFKGTNPVTVEGRDAMREYLSKQAAALSSVSKDLPFRDLSEDKKVPLPSQEVLSMFGPRAWWELEGLGK